MEGNSAGTLPMLDFHDSDFAENFLVQNTDCFFL